MVRLPNLTRHHQCVNGDGKNRFHSYFAGQRAPSPFFDYGDGHILCVFIL